MKKLAGTEFRKTKFVHAIKKRLLLFQSCCLFVIFYTFMIIQRFLSEFSKSERRNISFGKTKIGRRIKLNN